jgi:hypothetical protein
LGNIGNFLNQPANVFVLGGVTPALVVADGTGPSPLTLHLLTLSISASGVTVPSSVSIGSVRTQTVGGFTVPVFQAESTSTGGVVAYADASNQILVKTIDTAGAVVNTYTLTGVLTIKGITIKVASDGNIWIYYAEDTGGGTDNVKYFIVSSTATLVLGSTLIENITIAAQASVIEVSTTSQQVFYTIGNTGSGIDSCQIRYTTVTSTGTVASPRSGITNPDLASKPFTYDSRNYILGIYRSSVQGTYILLDVTDPTDIQFTAKVFQGEAFSFFSQTIGALTKVFGSAAATPFGYTARPISLASGRYGFTLARVVANQILGSVTQLTNTSFATFDFENNELYQSIEAADCLIFNGGIVRSYDGVALNELGFTLYPEVVSISASAGGALSAGTYQYAVVLEWTDSQGNNYQSAPTFASVVSPASGQVSITTYVTYTGKRLPFRASLAIYRSQANGTVLNLRNKTPTVVNTAFTDTAADTDIVSNNTLYTTGGVIENVAPPPAISLTVRNNRVYLIDSSNQNTIWYSKTIQNKVGLSFSDLFIQDVTEVAGPCIAVAAMDSNLVVLAEKYPLVIQGEGANDTGTGSTLTPAQAIPSDAGCTTSKGVIVFPGGVIRKTLKGIYLLDRSLADKYFGYEVERYNDQDITSTTLLPKVTQIRFLTSSGLTLVYDYFYNQWGTFTNHEGLSSCVWQDTYVYARASGEDIYKEHVGYYLDDTTAFAPLLQTAWLALSSVQNFQRVKRFGMLGSFTNGASASHAVQVSAAYDFSTTFSTPISFTFGAASASGSYQYRERLPVQKCDAISLLIEEITTGDSAEQITFTDMSFDAGMKKGLRKMPTTQSVG